MLSVLLAIHMIACLALVIAVMLQRSEGGALGMSGGGTGGIISGRGAAGVLVKTTMVLAAVFFTTSLVMTRLNSEAAKAPAAIERDLQDRQGQGFDPLSGAANPSEPSTSAPVEVDPLAPQSSSTTPAPAGDSAAPPADPLAPVINPAPAQENGGSTTP